MDEQSQNTGDEQHQNLWSLGCSGAIAGWLLLGAVTVVTFRLMQGARFYPTDSINVFFFKAGDGSVLGAVSALSYAWSRHRDFKRAGKVCIALGGVIAAFWTFIAVFGDAGNGSPKEKVEAFWCWDAATILWSVILVFWGIALLTKAKVK